MKILREKLEELGQEHLIHQYDQLQGQDQELFLQDLQNLDLELLATLLKKIASQPGDNSSQPSTPIANVSPHAMVSQEQQSLADKKRWTKLGQNALSHGKVGALLVAGGQGSRLGFEGPKGVYQFGLSSGASLFRLHAERIINLGRRLGQALPWAIMTSPQNHEETIAHFQENDFFGLKPEDIDFFQQGVLPAISTEGKILLEGPTKIQTAPDGNGGCFKAFHQSGVFEKWSNQGVEHLYIFSVDNCLVRPLDPEFVGFYLDQGKPSASTVVRKGYPEERVGIFALRDNLPTVIEYSELCEERINATQPNGDLLYDGGNMAIHLIHMNVLAEAGKSPLPYHKAIKKISYWDGEQLIHPNDTNAIKFEQFMFDIFPRCKSMALMEVERAEHFAPIKNATGNDSPETAKNLMLSLHKKWIAKAIGAEESSLNDAYEISPLLSYSGENLPNTLEEIQVHPLIYK